MLKLDGEKYQPGQGLKSDKILSLPTYRCDRTGEQCSICMNPIQIREKVKRLPCLHVFHADCVDEWLSRKPTCPVDCMEVEI